MYRMDQDQIAPLRLPNMGLKGGLGSSQVCPVLGVVVVFCPQGSVCKLLPQSVQESVKVELCLRII